ncbi:MAG: MoaD/ThiS family protein [Candidatus Lokiarchaeota archaeon]|nr:MoaD/ThiS family protein [Candidatus Lokiarchaeota archaeon]
MKQTTDLLSTGIVEKFIPEKKMLVRDLLRELNLEGKYFGILINGKKADEDSEISPEDDITILPHIAGGR